LRAYTDTRRTLLQPHAEKSAVFLFNKTYNCAGRKREEAPAFLSAIKNQRRPLLLTQSLGLLALIFRRAQYRSVCFN
jgi:hypothetical protein